MSRAVKYLQIPLITVLLVSAGVLMGENSLTQRRKLVAKKSVLAGENMKLTQEIKELERQVMLVRSDPKTIEKAAKRKLRMARPDETVYIFTRQNSARKRQPPAFGLSNRDNSR